MITKNNTNLIFTSDSYSSVNSKTKFIKKLCIMEGVHFLFRYGSWSYEKGRIDIDETSSIDVEHSTTHIGGWLVLNYSSVLLRQDYTGGI